MGFLCHSCFREIRYLLSYACCSNFLSFGDSGRVVAGWVFEIPVFGHFIVSSVADYFPILTLDFPSTRFLSRP
jgi:hypothetical protein